MSISLYLFIGSFVLNLFIWPNAAFDHMPSVFFDTFFLTFEIGRLSVDTLSFDQLIFDQLIPTKIIYEPVN